MESENVNLPIKLYSYAVSPYAQKVRCYLLYKDLPFETHYINPVAVKQELPIGHLVPVLSCGDEFRNESSEIGLWLDELFPDMPLVPDELRDSILEADAWVSDRLIPLVFRVLIGYGDPMTTIIRKRWAASEALDRSVPVGVSFSLRLMHLLRLGRAPMIKRLLKQTDLDRSNLEHRRDYSQKFEELLRGGPFLCGSEKPTLADLSAFPQIAFPLFCEGDDYLLLGPAITHWVAAMYDAVPNLRGFIPEQLTDQFA